MGLGAHAPILPASDVNFSHKDWALRLALYRYDPASRGSYVLV